MLAEHTVRKGLWRSAFTLIELMVAIGVIVTLIGVMLPGLAGARNRARATRCLTQLRSLGQITLQYADDHRDAMPRSQHSATSANMLPWGYAFYQSITGNVYTSGDPGFAAMLNGLYRCPSDVRKQRWSYGYNVYYELLSEETLGRTWTRAGQAPLPQATVVFGELNDLTTADHAMAHYWVQFAAPPEIDGQRHGSTCGAAFLDGHAAEARFQTLFDMNSNVDRFNPATAR